MITQPENNPIKLTDEQTAQLEEFQLRLTTLTSEIANHTKILKGIKSECDRAVSEKSYQEELLNKLSLEIPIKEAEKSSVEASIVSMTQSIDEIRKEAFEKNEEWNKKESELRQREAVVKETEIEVTKKHADIRKESAELAELKEKLTKVSLALKEALKTITW